MRLDVAVAIAVGGAILYLVGAAYYSAYYMRLGLDFVDATPIYPTNVIRGLSTLIKAFLMFAALVIAATIGDRRRRKHGVSLSQMENVVEDEQVPGVWTLLALGTISALAASMVGDFDLHQPPIVHWGCWQLSIEQLMYVLGTIGYTWFILRAATKSRSFAHFFVGRTFGGHVILSLLLLGSVASVGVSAGIGDAAGQLWHEKPYDVVDLHFTNSTSATFFLVAHLNGQYFVRQLEDVGGEKTPVIAYPDWIVTEVAVTHVPASSSEKRILGFGCSS